MGDISIQTTTCKFLCQEQCWKTPEGKRKKKEWFGHPLLPQLSHTSTWGRTRKKGNMPTSYWFSSQKYHWETTQSILMRIVEQFLKALDDKMFVWYLPHTTRQCPQSCNHRNSILKQTHEARAILTHFLRDEQIETQRDQMSTQGHTAREQLS